MNDTNTSDCMVHNPGFDLGVSMLEQEPLFLPRSDFQLLKRALLNERMAPELLQYKASLVHRTEAALQQQEAELIAMDCRQELELLRVVLTFEHDRLTWVLKAYLRTRLDKIERHAGHLLDAAELRQRLSLHERAYTGNFFVAVGRLFKTSILDKVPDHYLSLVKRHEADADKRLLEFGDFNKYVFCKVLQDCGQVVDGPDGQVVELHQGDVLAIKYTTVGPLVQSGQVGCL